MYLQFDKMVTQPIEIKFTDMPDEMSAFAVDCGQRAMKRFYKEDDMAKFIKREFTKKYLPDWQCAVGNNFGAFVNYQKHTFIYYYIGQMGVMLFKS